MSFRAMIDPNWAEHLPREPKDFVWQNNNNLDESLPIGTVNLVSHTLS